MGLTNWSVEINKEGLDKLAQMIETGPMAKTKDIPEVTVDESEKPLSMWGKVKQVVYKKIEGRDDLSFTEQVVALNEEQAEQIEKLMNETRRYREECSVAIQREREAVSKMATVLEAAHEKIAVERDKALEKAARILEDNMFSEPGFDSEPLEPWEERVNNNLKEVTILLRQEKNSNSTQTPLWDGLTL